ncbi:hypothetical protein LSAT2_024531 [Lamellibrachia satsuma]|nr:hypothetical protein LSAT2_024531 [Lamellibrachia satsuma]
MCQWKGAAVLACEFVRVVDEGTGPENEAAENVTEIPEEEFGEDVEDELEESGVKVSEEEFNFNDFILRFVSPRVVQAYVTLLSQYKTNSAHTNHCVLKMLHRVGFECEMIGILFQARLFRIFQNVQADPACTTRHFKELLRFTQHVVAQFIEVAQKNSKVFMELFFWKTVRDVRDITEGYGYTVHQSKKVKQLWSEEEDMELQQLVEQFRDEEPRDGDMADYVLANLIDQTKTRRQVVRQLVHLGLLGSAKDLKRRNGPVRSREWQEEEEEDLRQLLEEFKDNDYPLMDILSNLKVKRSRPKVIEKLLQLGLIQDKKEVMKKRKSKKSKNGKKGKRDFEEDLEGFDEGLPPPSDDEENVDEEPEMTVTSSDESVGDQSDVDDDEPIYITKIRKSAKQALNSGLQASVQWISDTLSRTADEREEDGDEEPIPVVPITEEAEEAMENPTFQTLLKRLRVKPPASEQEMFWRIAGKLSPNDLRSRVHALKTCLSTDNPDTRKTGGHLEALRALAKQKQADGGKGRRHRRSQTENTRSEDQVMAAVDQTELVGSGSNQSSPTMGHRAGKSRLKRSLPEFSEDESDNERLVIDTDEPAEATLQPAKRVKIVESDDSSDIDDKAGDTVNTQPHKRIMVVESDDSGAESSPDNGKTDVGATLPHTGLGSFPATMLSQTPDESDSDIDDHVPLRKVTKKCTIESDSDDD